MANASSCSDRKERSTALGEKHAPTIGWLAQKLPLTYKRSDLVVPTDVAAQLEFAVAWWRGHRHIRANWGTACGRRHALGFTALFVGPPGAGKTMAAQVLARRIRLDLYRIDLSQTMSKYIGETEKNLALLFDSLGASAILLNEADALFGRRRAMGEAYGRYANLAANYLLQRIEQREGVTVLTTNDAQDIDKAFLRRLQLVATFPVPSPQDRLRIWRRMLSKQAIRREDVDLVAIAREFALTGGSIRTATLAAALLAAAEAEPIAMRHLKAAIHRELERAGANPGGQPS